MIRWVIDPKFMTDAKLKAEYCNCENEAGDPRNDALEAEIERRHLDL